MDTPTSLGKIEREALKALLLSEPGQIVLKAWERDYINNPLISQSLTDTQIRYRLAQRELIQSFIDLLDLNSEVKRKTQVEYK